MREPGKLRERLEARIHEGNLRQMKVVEGLLDFSSNDYLGMAQNTEAFAPISSSDLAKYHEVRDLG